MICTAEYSGFEFMNSSRYLFPYNQREGSQSTAYEGKQAKGFSIGPPSLLRTFNHRQEGCAAGQEAEQERNTKAA